MRKMNTFFAYVATMNNGHEMIMMVFNDKGEQVPMIYPSKREAETEETVVFVKHVANAHKMFIELREYIVTENVTQYFPSTGVLQ